MSKERNSGIVLGLLAGAAIGSLLGVWFAPEKGSETRKRVRRKAEDLRDEALECYDNVREEALEYYEGLSEKARQGVETLRNEYEKFKQKREENSIAQTELDEL